MPILHVELSDEVYRELLKAKIDAGCRTWPEFLELVARGEIDIKVEIISVDGEPAEGHTVEFMLGDYRYLWNGSDFILLEAPERRPPLRATGRRVLYAHTQNPAQ